MEIEKWSWKIHGTNICKVCGNPALDAHHFRLPVVTVLEVKYARWLQVMKRRFLLVKLT